ncbi:MAG TPA: hypothetical protein VGX96_14390 [Candidatus Elarobacter sp.]|nr:hypothetical protein [Candidatus Elarobacter sp.]
MKRLIACASLVAAATTAAVPATTPSTSAPHPAAHAAVATKATKGKPVAAARPKCKIAPADEYFGKLKMSILGIRNTIKDQGLKVDVDPAKADTTLNAIALTEDAMHDWQRKYPCDGWIPGTIFALEHFYTKIHTADGVKHVHAAFAWLRHDFPRHKLVVVALREDGAASVGTGPAMASVPGAAEGPAASPAPNVQQSQILPAGGAAATPIPGTAPASVINAQNAMGASPSPTPKP